MYKCGQSSTQSRCRIFATPVKVFLGPLLPVPIVPPPFLGNHNFILSLYVRYISFRFSYTWNQTVEIIFLSNYLIVLLRSSTNWFFCLMLRKSLSYWAMYLHFWWSVFICVALSLHVVFFSNLVNFKIFIKQV